MDPASSAEMFESVENILKPYKEGFMSFKQLPEVGVDREEILHEMEKLKNLEQETWKEGFVSGAVYHGDENHIDFLNRIYAYHSQSNPLHPDVWPSTTKFEAEIVAMTADMLGAGEQEGICGTVSSGGTESILLAMKTYRDWAERTKGIIEAEIIAPTTAHAAFDKAAQYFRMKIIRTPIDSDYRADVDAVRSAITDNTVVIVGSAPPYPHGIVDPIEELSELARKRDIGFHTDACMGGFILPWIKRLGFDVPAFDFRLPGVTSISADTHKFGYAAKGTSVILYRTPELRHFQYYLTTDWPGGLYNSPTLAGSRPGALSAVCWAAMVSIGEKGYLRAAKEIMNTSIWLRDEIESIPELKVLGDPLFIIAFASDVINIYQVMEVMTQKGWGLNGLHLPPSVHICVTLRHTQSGVKEKLIEDLRMAVEYVKENPAASEGIGPVYGMAASPEMRGMVTEVLKWYLDTQYKV
ncbi:MAG: aminotransferase class V-fold PLP-dependent enzyme [Anaerolineales bacterium]|nr:aminotransferase class V-fold PLP-dependent enzyme [Anaerolineales bacterium]